MSAVQTSTMEHFTSCASFEASHGNLTKADHSSSCLRAKVTGRAESEHDPPSLHQPQTGVSGKKEVEVEIKRPGRIGKNKREHG